MKIPNNYGSIDYLFSAEKQLGQMMERITNVQVYQKTPVVVVVPVPVHPQIQTLFLLPRQGGIKLKIEALAVLYSSLFRCNNSCMSTLN